MLFRQRQRLLTRLQHTSIHSSRIPRQLHTRRSMSTHIYATPAEGQPKDAPPQTVKLTTHNQYTSPRLVPSSLDPNPLTQFNRWFTEALDPPAGIPAVREPEAMAVSTVNAQGIPSTRIVLLKTVDPTGFIFFTNYKSRKSSELANGYASIAFYWKEVSRQVRVVGRVEKVSRQDSEEYFASRPVGSRIGAWASEQSTVVGEDTLVEKVKQMEEKYGDNVPCPEHWGGWRVVPFEVEFWCGQPSRLHDRFRYTRPEGSGSSEWTIDRLAP